MYGPASNVISRCLSR